jgi:hypothetical protein
VKLIPCHWLRRTTSLVCEEERRGNLRGIRVCKVKLQSNKVCETKVKLNIMRIITNSTTRNSIVYIVSYVITVTIILILSHRAFSDEAYIIRATDISVILYTAQIFLLPMLMNIAFSKTDPSGKYLQLLTLEYLLSVFAVVLTVLIFFDDNTVISAIENYDINDTSFLFILYRIIKVLIFLILIIIFCKGVYRSIICFTKK